MTINWWTLVLQTVNLLILVWLLAHFFFRPVAALVAKRQLAINKALADAASARDEATALQTKNDAARAEIAAARAKMSAEAQAEVEREKTALLAQATREIQQAQAEAQKQLDQTRASERKEVFDYASSLAVEIARRLLARVSTSPDPETFLEGVRKEIVALPPTARQLLGSAPAAVIAHRPLSPQQETKIRDQLSLAVGAPIVLSFQVNPDLIAGVEFHSGSTVVRNTWREDLSEIREELERTTDVRSA
jgi:F-type H+-transporting ATPase subunit b